MRTIIYISGIFGGLLLVIRLIGIITEFKYNDVFLFSGLVLIILVFIPLSVISKYKHNKKIKSIIKSYSDNSSKDNTTLYGKSEMKGWNINNSPYRKRKSGLKWSGGNIHGSNASR